MPGVRIRESEHFDAALAELRDYPAPLVAWRVYAGAARAKAASGDLSGAHDASARATEIVNSIAANVADEKLRATFLAATAKKLS